MDSNRFRNILKTESVFKNQKSLAQSWVPSKDEKLYCRDNEIKRLSIVHRPIIATQGEYSTNTLVLGVGGIGKTLTVRYFTQEFRNSALADGVKIKAEYFDCLQHRSKSSILRRLSEMLHYSAGHGYADNEIIEQILRGLKKNNECLLIVLDEIHHLSSDDILALLNASIGFGQKNARFCIICISRSTDWFKVENEKIMSRIQEKIRMDSYTRDEALQVLQYRKTLAFREGIIDNDVMTLIADICTDTKNMRVGIDILRSCGTWADQQNLTTITAEMVLSMRNQISPTFRADIIDNLTLHEKFTLWAIARTLKQLQSPYAKVEQAYEEYQILCEEYNIRPHVTMSFRKYIRNLASIKAIYKEYLNPTMEKRGRQIQVKLIDISAEKLAEYFVNIIPPDIQDDQEEDNNSDFDEE